MGSVNRTDNRLASGQRTDGDQRHHVAAGETLSQIALRYGVSLEQMLAANRQVRDSNSISAGQTLFIPSQPRALNNATSRTSTVALEERYTIRSGASMWEIASRRGIEVESLLRANLTMRDPGRASPGERLNIPVNDPGAPRSQSSPVVQPLNTRTTERNVAPNSTRNGFERVDLEQFLSGGTASQAAIIVGTSEGNRTPSGGFRGSFDGHTDPGNGARNIGSFSYQGRGARTPEQADRIWLQELQRVTPRYREAAQRAGLDPQNSLLASSYYDLYTQSPRSAGRLLRDLVRLKRDGVTPQQIVEARMRSYVDPETGRLSASGFNNDPVALRADQTRRTRELVRALRAQGLER